MAAAMNCNDRNNVATARTSYVYDPALYGPLWLHGPCTANTAANPTRRCEKGSQSDHHRGKNHFMSCHHCDSTGKNVTARYRKPAGAPAAMSFRYIQSDLAILRVNLGAWGKGRLCDLCINQEILNYYNRYHVNYHWRQQPPAPNAWGTVNTCTCKPELEQRLCIQDRISTLGRIQTKSDRIAGRPPNTRREQNWLYDLDYDAARECAVRAQGAQLTLLRNRRTLAAVLDEACRCGRDVAAGPGPHPVLQCTACSGVVIFPNHAQVTSFTGLRLTRSQTRNNPALQRAQTREPDLRYGRRLR